MDYYYSQNYGLYANYGISEPTMAQAGCVITCLAMILSYFNDKAYYPEQMLSWGRKYGMIDASGRTNFSKFCEAAGNKLRMVPNVRDVRPDEVVYGLREVRLKNGLLHWVIDSPVAFDMIIDPWDGKLKNYNYYKGTGHGEYTGRAYYYIGKR